MPAKSDLSREIVREVRGIYQELAGRPIQRDCQMRTECCHFVKTGRTPHLTAGEAVLAAKALRATGRKKLPESAGGACPLLDPSTLRCLIYADRPFGCRTHFCNPAGGMVDRDSVIDLIRKLEAIDARMGGDGARMLPRAVADSLATMR